MIRLSITGKVPAKSNTYKVIKLGRGRDARCSLTTGEEAKAYQALVNAEAINLKNRLGGHIPYPEGRVELWCIWHRNEYDGRKRDMDNILKGVKDALNKTIWTDDSQVSRLVVEEIFDAEDEWLEIVVQPDALNPQPKTRSRRSSTSSTRTRSTSSPASSEPPPAKKSARSARTRRSAPPAPAELDLITTLAGPISIES